MQWPKKPTKEQTMIDKTLQRKLTIEQDEPHKMEMNSVATDGYAVLAPQVTSVVLLLKGTHVMWYGNCVKH